MKPLHSKQVMVFAAALTLIMVGFQNCGKLSATSSSHGTMSSPTSSDQVPKKPPGLSSAVFVRNLGGKSYIDLNGEFLNSETEVRVNCGIGWLDKSQIYRVDASSSTIKISIEGSAAPRTCYFVLANGSEVSAQAQTPVTDLPFNLDSATLKTKVAGKVRFELFGQFMGIRHEVRVNCGLGWLDEGAIDYSNVNASSHSRIEIGIPEVAGGTVCYFIVMNGLRPSNQIEYLFSL